MFEEQFENDNNFCHMGLLKKKEQDKNDHEISTFIPKLLSHGILYFYLN